MIEVQNIEHVIYAVDPSICVSLKDTPLLAKLAESRVTLHTVERC